MHRVVKEHGSDQKNCEHRGHSPKEEKNYTTEQEPTDSITPHFLQRNRAGRDWTLRSMLLVEFKVEGVVQVHATDVNATRSHANAEKPQEPPVAPKKPSCQAIRPDRGQIRHAPQDEQGP